MIFFGLFSLFTIFLLSDCYVLEHWREKGNWKTSYFLVEIGKEKFQIADILTSPETMGGRNDSNFVVQSTPAPMLPPEFNIDHERIGASGWWICSVNDALLVFVLEKNRSLSTLECATSSRICGFCCFINRIAHLYLSSHQKKNTKHGYPTERHCGKKCEWS